MNKRILYVITAGSILFCLTTTSVMAQTTSPQASGTRLAQREANLQQRALTEINARIDSLNKIVTTLNGIKKISDSDRSALTSQVQGQITAMQNLLTKIQADTDVTTLRTDVQSITKAYRIYWLFMPKVHVLAAADRINDVTESMQTVSGKIQSRITSLGSQGTNFQSSLDDADAKIKDSQVQAANAVSLVANLQPDNGDDNVLQSNITALKSARNDIQTANQELKTAYQDFKTIVQGIKGLKTSSSASPTP